MTQTTNVGAQPVTTLAAEEVERVDPDATLHEVADLLTAGDVGALVLGARTPAAIVTERDLVRALAERRDPSTTLAREIASTGLVWCDATATVADAAAEMMGRYVRHVLVEDDGELVGIVSARDVMGAYAAGDIEPVDDDW